MGETGNQMSTLIAMPPAQIVGNIISADGVERIAKYIIDEHEAKHNVPADWSYKFFVDRNEKKTYIYKENAAKKGEMVQFLNCIIENVIEVVYTPKLYFNDGKLLIFSIGKDREMIFIDNDCWGKKAMLQMLRNYGIIFSIYKSESVILQNLMNHLAEFKVTKFIRVDPQAGWTQCGLKCESTLYPELIGNSIQSKTEQKWKFQSAENWLPAIPSIVQKKTLFLERCNHDEIILGLVPLKIEPVLSLLLFSILFLGITVSRFVKECNFIQGKFIIINTRSLQAIQFFKKIFTFYIEDEEQNLSLSMPNKELQNILLQSKDQPLVVDADAEDISGRRKQNIATLKNYVCSGSLSNGQKANAIVLLLSRGLSPGISLDDSLVFDINEDECFRYFMSNSETRRNMGGLISYLIPMMEKEEKWFIEHFGLCRRDSELGNILNCIAQALINISAIKKYISEPEKTLDELKNLINSAKTFADVDGISSVVAKVILENIQKKGGIKLRMTKEKVDAKELDCTILIDKKALYLSDELLTKFILPEFASKDVKPITLRKVLAQEGLINCYTSESGSKSNKKKRPIYSRAGNLYCHSMTEINRARLEELLEVDFDDLVEVM